MGFSVLLGLANPMTWLIVATLAITCSRLRNRKERDKNGRPRRPRSGAVSAAGLGAAFQFLSLAYRPNHAFIAKAQIQRQEDADEDDAGGPDTPIKHLRRQLRRIRRGEPVDTLVWRLE